MARSRLAVGCIVAFVALGFRGVLAQQPSTADLAKMVQDLMKKVEQNTQEIGKLKESVAQKDKALAEKDAEINKLKATTSELGQKVTKVDAVEQAVQTYIKESDEKAKKEKPGRENEFGVLVGAMSGPYGTHAGPFFGGFADFAWIPKDPLGNKISGEIFAMFGETARRYPQVTSAILGEQGPQTQEIDTLAVIVGPKYTIKWFEPIRPYFVTGLGMYVYGQEMSNRFVMGQAPVAEELASRHSPAGNADLQFGVNIGGGIEWRVNDLLSLGCDVRQNLVTGRETEFTTIGGYVSLNF